MRIGDTLQAAIWLSGRESEAERRQLERDMDAALDRQSAIASLGHGPLVFYELRPGDERVPPVPAHIDGPDVRLLVGEAELTARPSLVAHSFLAELGRRDLERLRAVTRTAYARSHPGVWLSDGECDSIVEALGPEAAMDAVRQAVDARGARGAVDSGAADRRVLH